MIQKLKLSSLLSNEGQIEGLPKNPRFIKDEKFKALIKSLEDDPEMLEIRELLVYPFGEKFVIIGGNMRFRAASELGLLELPCKVLDIDTPAKKLRAFTIKDNVAFGQDDFDILANEWDNVELLDFGLVIPDWSAGINENNMNDEDVNIEEEFNAIGTMEGKQRVVFLFDGTEEAETYLNNLKVDFKKMNMAWQVDLCIPSI